MERAVKPQNVVNLRIKLHLNPAMLLDSSMNLDALMMGKMFNSPSFDIKIDTDHTHGICTSLGGPTATQIHSPLAFLTYTGQAGGVAGVCVDLILFPLDTIKTRLQSPQGFNKAGGFRGIYAGVPSAAIGSFPNAAAFFITYEYVKWFLHTDSSSYLMPVKHMLAASAGEVVACLIRVPSEVVKQRAQVSASSGTFHIFSNILCQENCSHCEYFKTQTLEKGIQGLYRGYKSTVLREMLLDTVTVSKCRGSSTGFGVVLGGGQPLTRYIVRKMTDSVWDDYGLLADCDSGPRYSLNLPGTLTQLEITAQGSCRHIPFSLVQFPLWESLKALWSWRQDHVVDSWQSAVCGAFAGGFAAAVTTPLDVAKTRIMLAKAGSSPASGNVLSALHGVWRTRGLSGLAAFCWNLAERVHESETAPAFKKGSCCENCFPSDIDATRAEVDKA
ncbi:hypothetical protein E2I00_009774 [Balaenoptera physalus]|uniref:Mitochondrial S-adenosylmethionine carrier protein n=1 Tax=Balaenoptera physalus TaxID=9770 RepID=A0A6A1Q769_BALPH|nr:hypothetical protein E2I00_009774 [Balaenoptera physalus]